MREHPGFTARYERLPGFRYNEVYVKTTLVDALLPTIPQLVPKD